MECPITYLYTLRNDKNEIFYVGKTKAPTNRFSTHYSKINIPFTMELVKEYYDDEDKFILELISKGENINNIQIPYNLEGKYSVGTKFLSENIKLKNKPIFDKMLNKTFNTIKECAEYYKVQPYIISNHLRGVKTSISEKLQIEYPNI